MKNIIGRVKINQVIGPSTIIDLLVLILGIIAAGIYLSQQKELDTISYMKIANEYRPKIVIRKPSNLNIERIIDTSGMAQKFREAHGHIHILHVKAKLKLRFQVQLYNDGNSQANLVGYLMADSLYQGELLVEDIKRHANMRKLVVNISPSNITIDKGNSITFGVKAGILNLKRHEFTLHLLILYENDFHILYSTYCWIKYKVDMPPAFGLNSNRVLRYIILKSSFSGDNIKLIKQSNLPEIVDLMDTTVIRNYIREKLKNYNVDTNKLFPYFPPEYDHKITIK